LSEIPLWELLVSIAILILSIWGLFVLTTKLFRTYLLMYGIKAGFEGNHSQL